ncbi:MAG: hypothetical protein HYR72_18780 [Deltaproteobacteria bacterium]|nr:hypothetical protein [Deltaproteobacteria bacterium]MBI3386233.1 hypothetical protein [Deltaproteobacteria bacterium]
MSMLGRIFGTPEERNARDLLKKAKAETSEVYGPLGDLSLAIVRAAWDSYQDFASSLQFSIEGQPTEQQMLVFYELLYFFIHVTFRTAAKQGLTETQISKLQGYMGPQLSQTAVDTFCRHWPAELKKRIAHDFLKKVNDAEVDYSECRVLMLKDKPFEKESLFGKLSHNVAQLWGSPSDPVVIIAAMTSAAKAFASMPLDRSIHDVAMVIDRVEFDALAALRDRPWP